MNEVIKIGDSSIPVIEWEGQRVITSGILAHVYGAAEGHIKQNFNNNKERFKEGRHFYLLKGEELKEFKRLVKDFDLPFVEPLKFTSRLYLWTRGGARLHSKMLGTDKAWEWFDELEGTYYSDGGWPMNGVVKIGDSSIPVLEWKGQRVITTSQLAEVYGTDTENIKKNFQYNKEHFKEKEHYFYLAGDELKEFKDLVTDLPLVQKNTPKLYLWTRKGASRHCKMLGTDMAWEQFDRLEENYYNPKRQPLPNKEGQKRNALSSVNMMVKNITDVLQKAGVEPVFIAAEVARIYTDQGYEVQAPLVTDKGTMPKLYDCTEIARELGIMSKGGLPHSQAVSAIIKKLWITEDAIVTTAFSKNGHEDVTTQYRPSVVDSVKDWLEENNYPTKIPFVDSKGNHKMRTVVYQRPVDKE